MSTTPTDNAMPQHVTELNGVMYYSAMDNLHGRELWRSDGTPAGTYMVKDISPGFQPSFDISYLATHFATVNNHVVFTAYTPATNTELWSSDGTAAGTVMLADIKPGTESSGISDFTYFNGYLYFTASDYIHGEAIWRTDGTVAGNLPRHRTCSGCRR